MKKTALYLILITIISKILGFGREIVLAYYYGTSNISDAYLISQTIPGTIFEFIGLSISTTFIPIYMKIMKEKNEEEANGFTSNLMNVLLVLSILIVIVVNVFSESIVTLFASGFDKDTLHLASMFTQVSIVGICFTSLNYILSSYLQVKNKFLIVSLAGIPFNFVIVLSIIVSSQYSSLYLPLGSLVAASIQFIILYYVFSKNDYSHKLRIKFDDENLKNMIILSLPVLVGASVNQLNKLVDRTLASRISIGGISGLNYSNRLNSFIEGIFVMPIIMVIYPMLANLILDSETEKFKKLLTSVIGSIFIVIVPIMMGTLLFSEEIIQLLFGRGAFEEDAVKMTSKILFFYSLGMIGSGIREILSRAFYAMNDTRTPMINAVIGIVINITLNIILSRYIGVGGLALATSISANIIALLLFINLRKKLGPIGIGKLLISFIKIVAASSIMGLLSNVSFNYLINNLNQDVALLISIGIGIISYFILINFMKIEEMDIIVKSIKRKVNKIIKVH